MSLLVTGGAGYIGSHTVRLLAEQGHDVVVLDSLANGHPDAVIGARLVVGDIAEPGLVESVCRDHGVTGIIHFAAAKSVGESMAHPEIYWRNNVAGTVELVEGALAAGVDRLVFSSSCSVYGTPEQVPVDEMARIDPESVYAESKATVERILRWYGVTKGLRSVSLRYFNAAGASFDARIGEDWTTTLNLVPLVLKAMLGRRPPVQVFGDDYPTPDGTAIRDYIHVVDLADAHARAIDHLAGGGETTALNLGTGTGSSVLEVIRMAEQVADQPVPYEVVARRAGDPVRVYADCTRARQVLGWVPASGLQEIVATAYEWHRTHPDGYGPRPA